MNTYGGVAVVVIGLPHVKPVGGHNPIGDEVGKSVYQKVSQI